MVVSFTLITTGWPLMSVDEKTHFPLLNNDNYMEAELICKGLWDNKQ
jgi:hypothetical protein